MRWFGLQGMGLFLLGAFASLQSGLREAEVAEVAVAMAGADGQARLLAGPHLEGGRRHGDERS